MAFVHGWRVYIRVRKSALLFFLSTPVSSLLLFHHNSRLHALRVPHVSQHARIVRKSTAARPNKTFNSLYLAYTTTTTIVTPSCLRRCLPRLHLNTAQQKKIYTAVVAVVLLLRPTEPH